MAQSSAVRETAGQASEPEYARGDHMLYISFIVVFACFMKTNLLKALGFDKGKNWSISEILRNFMDGFTRSHSVLL